MSYLSFDSNLIDRAATVARGAGLNEDRVLVGILMLWDAVLIRQKPTVPDIMLDGYFGPGERVRAILQTFRVVERAGDEWRVVGAECNIRTAARTDATIYFIQRGEGGPIKIGITASLTSRLRSLQTSSPTRLTVLATMPGTVEDEAGLHERFAAVRLSGEWFEPAEVLLAFIATLSKGVP